MSNTANLPPNQHLAGPPPRYNFVPGQQQLITPPNANSMSYQLPQHQITGPPASLANGAADPDSDDSDEEQEGRQSEIHLKIATPLIITGNGNIISIDAATNASKVSIGVVSALRQMSSAGGVPMIDEDGRPRPINLNISAETRINGSMNVIGEKAILAKTVVGGQIKKIDPQQPGGPAAERIIPKRERSGSEPIEMDSKKARRD